MIKFKKYMTKINHNGSVLGWRGEKYIHIRHKIRRNWSIQNCSGLTTHNNNDLNTFLGLLPTRLWSKTVNLDTIQCLV